MSGCIVPGCDGVRCGHSLGDCPDCKGTGVEHYGAPCRRCRRGIGYAIQRRLDYASIYLTLWGLYRHDLRWPILALRALWRAD